ncbi:imelysin family protein [Pseudomonas mangrovi]|uniref:Imelysin n=1 Tax=Pseudomonas mangrovi TaxID=2161748 RepID=A0A2T5PEQ4_9PSED|nr:imelysin family protein [Pseudomonas mangrovi]PTU76212.1 imelysin [Pseudomonas mangrovi]
MQTSFRLLGSLALTLALAACAPQDPHQKVSAALASNVLLPAYHGWSEANRTLEQSARAFCAGEQDLTQARQHFSAAQSAWAALQPLAVGPLSEGNRAWQVQFWPDKKNLVGRQVERLVQSNPQLDAAALGKASVVVQGLSAYEYLLFDPALDLADDSQKARYCPMLQAIASHQRGLADEVLNLWEGEQGMAAMLRSTPNTRYPDGREALGELLRTQVSALDGLKKKLGTPLGRQSKGVAQPFQAEAWRSKASLANLAAALASAEQVWRGNDDNGVRSLPGAQHQNLVKRIDEAFSDTRKRLAAQQRPLGEALADPAAREELDALYDSLDRLHRLHESELSRALEIPLGFNAHDGD